MGEINNERKIINREQIRLNNSGGDTSIRGEQLSFTCLIFMLLFYYMDIKD